jgi:ATP-dependent RNA helicase DeaD
MSDAPARSPSFADFDLPAALLQALDKVGYETPSPIQAEAIPPLLAGRDLLGHAPTGTGKTAAFALPLLARLDLSRKDPQVLTLTPTRELAIQVAEAFSRYASAMPGFHVLPIYGGQSYTGQIRQLQRGVHVVVGTPGRVTDHMRKGRLRLDGLTALVLDEADEMLRMGFIEEVEWILEQTPDRRQMALFSATMPKEIERIARRHLRDPHQISIKSRTATAETVRQRYWIVSGMHKLDALTRILEVEPFEAMLVFVRTKTATAELAERLEARGHAAAPLNGDMDQKQREQTVERLKSGALDIVVATDVAARGLDVERVSHVVNFDIPYDAEAYIHRIGRTGRAGRKGEAILFVAPRERRMLGAIERASRQKMELLELPSAEMVNNRRIAQFKQKITDTLAAGELDFMQGLINQYQREHEVPAIEVAAALAKLSLGDAPLLLQTDDRKPQRSVERRSERGGERPPERPRERQPGRDRGGRSRGAPEAGMERFRIEVGHEHGVQPGNIVGAIANEAGIEGRNIGQIAIEDTYSLIDLPVGMPREIFRDLKKVWVCGQQLRISRPGDERSGDGPDEAGSEGAGAGQRPDAPAKPSPRSTLKFKTKPKARSKEGPGKKPKSRSRAAGKTGSRLKPRTPGKR